MERRQREHDLVLQFRDRQVIKARVVTKLDELLRDPSIYWNEQYGWFVTIFPPTTA